MVGYLSVFGSLISQLNRKAEITLDLDQYSLIVSDFSLLGRGTSWGVYDLFFAMLGAYSLLSFWPTFLCNVVILLKELFMSQTAFDLANDYQQGHIFGLDLDLMQFLGVSGSKKFYLDRIKEFTKEYF